MDERSQIEQELHRVLPAATPAQIRQLAEIFQSLITHTIPKAVAIQRLQPYKGLVSALEGSQLLTDAGELSIARGAQLGDLHVGNVAGRDSFVINEMHNEMHIVFNALPQSQARSGESPAGGEPRDPALTAGASSPQAADAAPRLLFALASPWGTKRDLLVQEIAAYGRLLGLETLPSAAQVEVVHFRTLDELRRKLREQPCAVLHLSGHATGHGLVIEDERGRKYILSQWELAEVLREYATPGAGLSCVILSACYNLSQGRARAMAAPYTIFLEAPVGDAAATPVLKDFYSTVLTGAGHVGDAFQAAQRAAEGRPELVARFLEQGAVSHGVQLMSSRPQLVFSEHTLRLRQVQALVGFAIDISNSMSKVFKGPAGEAVTRLEGFRLALERLVGAASQAVVENRAQGIQTSIQVFGYLFGLNEDARLGRIFDLLGLIGAVKVLIERYPDEVINRNSESEVQMIASKFMRELSPQSKQLTAPIELVAQLWGVSKPALARAERFKFLFGNTPIGETFDALIERFQAEMGRLNQRNLVPILFLLSDGVREGFDKEPDYIRRRAVKLKELGVVIVCCYITERPDVDRVLLNDVERTPQSDGARLLFDLASEARPEYRHAIERFLLHSGWRLSKDAKMFVEVNSPTMLEEFIRTILSPLELEDPDACLPIY